MAKKQSPIIILSAARSGSKLFRDVMSQHPEVVAIPYDINYVWKYKNYHRDDELEPQHLTDVNLSFIKKFILNHVENDSAKIVLEKTVSNTLRVEFVRAVFPDAKFIHLYRDGRDVALSARSCWNASTVSSKNQSRSILIRKITSYPFLKTFPYISNKIIERLKFKTGLKKTLPIWGPQFRGIENYIEDHELIDLCAHQWARCVSKTLSSLEKLERNNNYISVSYEDFVKWPESSLNQLAEFLDIKDIKPMLNYANRKIDANYMGQWKNKLTADEQEAIKDIVEPLLLKLDYRL